MSFLLHRYLFIASILLIYLSCSFREISSFSLPPQQFSPLSFIPRPQTATTTATTTKLNNWVYSVSDRKYIFKEPKESTTKDDRDKQSGLSSSQLDTLSPTNIIENDAEKTKPTRLESGQFKPKQSLGQNFITDGNYIRKIVEAFGEDVGVSMGSAVRAVEDSGLNVIELGPGPGALTSLLYTRYSNLTVIEIDQRSIPLLLSAYPNLNIIHNDVLKVNYSSLSTNSDNKSPLNIIGNLPYYISSQILFTLADASHHNSIASATVTMQLEVAQRLNALPSKYYQTHDNNKGMNKVKDYNSKSFGILSVVFGIYTKIQPKIHFTLPGKVFYPPPKVTSALIGLHFIGSEGLDGRLCGVRMGDLKLVVKAAFRMRRKKLSNCLRKVVQEACGGGVGRVDHVMRRAVGGEDDGARATAFIEPELPQAILNRAKDGDYFAINQRLPLKGKVWDMRGEELWPAQYIELTRLVFGSENEGEEEGYRGVEDEGKVWRGVKLKGKGDGDEDEEEVVDVEDVDIE